MVPFLGHPVYVYSQYKIITQITLVIFIWNSNILVELDLISTIPHPYPHWQNKSPHARHAMSSSKGPNVLSFAFLYFNTNLNQLCLVGEYLYTGYVSMHLHGYLRKICGLYGYDCGTSHPWHWQPGCCFSRNKKFIRLSDYYLCITAVLYTRVRSITTKLLCPALTPFL